MALTRLPLTPFARSLPPKRRTGLAFLLLAAIALFALPGLARQNPQELIREGNKLWEEKSYRLAGEAYEKALAADPKLPDRAEYELRLAISLLESQQWDKATAAIDAFVEKYKNTPQEVRGQVWRGRTYLRVVHNGYRVGKKLYRGSEVPKSEGKDQPVYVDLSYEDTEKAKASFYRAKALCEDYRKAKNLPANEQRMVLDEEVYLNFDLANLLSQTLDMKGRKGEDVDWSLDPTHDLDSNWPTPKQVMHLYEQLPLLDKLRPNSDGHDTVLAALGKATYVLTLRQMGPYYYVQPRYGRDGSPVYNGGFGGRGRFRGQPYYPRPIPIYIPYRALDPIKVLQDIVDHYPNDREADRLAYTIALWTERKGDNMAAIGRYSAFIGKYPNSRWVSDAKGQIANLMRPSLSVSTPGVTRAGERARINVASRNLKTVRFTAYRIGLEDILGKVEFSSYGGEPLRRHPFSDMTTQLAYAKNYRKEKVAKWTATTNDNGTHTDSSISVGTPLDSNGAYLIEARAGQKNEYGSNTVAIVSDVTLVQRVDRKDATLYVTDVKTGKPISGAKLVVWSPRHTNGNPEMYHEARYLTGETDGGGTARIELTKMDGPNSGYPVSRRIAETFAFVGKDRYAITNSAEYYSQDATIREDGRIYRAFIQTDRPLYRPKNEVHIQVLMTEDVPAQYRPAANRTATLTVMSPKGAEILRKAITTNAEGRYDETLTLADKADLGGYTVAVTDNASPTAFSYSGTFYVEEYKKPEFTVSVMPEKSQVRIGEEMRVTVSARYFFGSPVAGAKVKYTVVRNYYNYPIPFLPKRDWYDNVNEYGGMGGGGVMLASFDEKTFFTGGGSGGGRFAPQPASGPFKTGELTTDANGEAKIVFPAIAPRPAKGQRYSPQDLSFSIVAEVTDDSRRQVAGAGSATAAASQFRAFMKTDKNFVQAGENMRIEVRTRDANNKPVGTDGTIRILRLIPAIPEEKKIDPKTGKEVVVVKYVPPREELAGVMKLSTEAAKEGAGVVYWSPDSSGDFRLDFTAKDRYGNTITASVGVLVYGNDFDNRLNKDDRRFTITPEVSDYRAGETAKLLIVTPMPDSYVLLSEQRNGYVVRYRTVFVPGRSSLLELPVTKAEVPNVMYYGICVREGGVYEAAAEIGVPADDKMLTLTVTPDKPTYKPGEKANFRIVAKDALGRPVKGTFNLSVVDESLLAMQPDITPDIRRYFYGFRIQTTIAGAHSMNYSANGQAFAPPVEGYEYHALSFPEGMGYVRDYIYPGQNLPEYVVYYDYVTNGRYDNYFGAQGGMGRSGGFSGGFGGGGGRGGGLMPPGMRQEDLIAYDADASILVRKSASTFYAYNGAIPVVGRLMDGPAEKRDSAKDKESGAVLVEATVRRLFADTAFWTPTVTTDADGTALVTFAFPDNITNWKVTARGMTPDVKVGVAMASAITKKNVLVRLQAPRFFVDRDKVTLSANVHNYLETAKNTRVELVVDGEHIVLAGNGTTTAVNTTNGNTAVRQTEIKKDEEKRFDWTVDIKKAGKTKIKVVAQTDTESDASEMEFPVYVHGVEKFLTQNGILRNGGTQTVTLDIPEMRRQGDTLLNIQMQPSLAAVMLDALPYLEDFPYGCLEQTLSRFVPTVLVAKALRDAGTDLETLGKRAQALEEQRKNIPPQKIYEDSGYTYPKGIPGVLNVQEMASRLSYPGGRRSKAPIFDSGVLKRMTDDGLERLYRLQRPSGGWSWWEGSRDEDVYLSALVVEFLTKAKEADIPVKDDVLNRGNEFLRVREDGTDDLQLRAYYRYVLSLPYRGKKVELDTTTVKRQNFLYDRRDRLNSYGKALLALALHNMGERERPAVLLRNLVDKAKFDERGNVHWEPEDNGYYWRWYNDKQETTAIVLRALVAIAPQEQLNPVNGPQDKQKGLAPLAVRWLVDNRRGGYWTSTRQTANVVAALLEYAKAAGELAPDYTVTVDVDGKVRKEYRITKENALLFDNRFLAGDEVLTTGANKVTITMQGTGTLYYNTYLKYFDMQEPIKGVANAIAVERKYYKIVSGTTKNKRGQPVPTSERVPLADGATLTSGDIVEVELFLKSDNDYDYLVFEDMKPAGCEAVETRSGTAYGDGLCSNFELRDEKVAFFIDTLPQGTRRIVYRLRAEIPGAFHALPTNGYAFYTPDIRALSDEWRVTIKDAPDPTASPKRK